MDGILHAQFAYPNVTYRNVIAPSANIPSSFYPLNPTQTEVDQIRDLGMTDGTATAASTTSVSVLSHYFMLRKIMDK